MNTKQISLPVFADSFRVIIGKSIWKVIHPADGWLTIDIGEKYIDTLPGKDGKDELYEKGQYQIHVHSDWEVYIKGELVESRQVNNNDQITYFDRMEKLASNFPIKKITSVELVDNTLVISGNNAEIKIYVSESSDSISLTGVELNADKNPISYTLYRFNEKLGSLACEVFGE